MNESNYCSVRKDVFGGLVEEAARAMGSFYWLKTTQQPTSWNSAMYLVGLLGLEL